MRAAALICSCTACKLSGIEDIIKRLLFADKHNPEISPDNQQFRQIRRTNRVTDRRDCSPGHAGYDKIRVSGASWTQYIDFQAQGL
jgi:hypothetical protein